MSKKILIVAALFFGALAVPAYASNSYSTSFGATENPISEGGKWFNGAVDGLDWYNVQVVNSHAAGTQNDNSSGYDDPTAILKGTWGPDQTLQATVYTVNQTDNYWEEVELRLRTTVTAHSIQGYEIMFSLRPSGSYCSIARWNGPLAIRDQNNPSNDNSNHGFTGLDSLTGNHGSSPCPIHNGDVLKATIIGNVITGYVNDVEVARATDDTYSSGNPGIGFDNVAPIEVNNDFGFTDFSASDNGSATTTATTTTPSGDTEAPTTPGSFTAVALSSSVVNLSWATSTDNVGVAGYEIFINSGRIATTSATAYTDSGLQASTTYPYSVRAYDATGLFSAFTPTIPVTTFGITAPDATSTATTTATTTASTTDTTTATTTANTTNTTSTSVTSTGGGGGSSNNAPSDSPSPTPTPTTPAPQPIPLAPRTPALPFNPSFITIPLFLGMNDPQVLILQNFLINQGYLHSKATGYYGPMTQAAVSAFQKDKGITPTGSVGPLTRATVNGLGLVAMSHPPQSPTTNSQLANVASAFDAFAQASPSASPAVPQQTTPRLTKPLWNGVHDPEVVTLQKFLAAKGFLNTSATGFFGQMTKQAVSAYQSAFGIPTTGTVGPRTRASINASI